MIHKAATVLSHFFAHKLRVLLRAKNGMFFSTCSAPLNACVIRGVFFDTVNALSFSHKKLENLLKFSDLVFSTPPAPLNVCVIRGVFLCPNFELFQRKEVEWSI